MAQKQETYDNYVSATFQLILIIITSSIVMGLLYWPYRTFTPLDEAPVLQSFTPERLVEFGMPTQVRSGMYVKDFVSVDMVAGTMVTDLLVWFIFDPSLISLDTIGEFSFANGTIVKPDKPEEVKKRAATRIADGGMMLAQYDIRVEFRLPLQYDLFPLDDHTAYFVLVNNFATPRQMIFGSVRQDFIVTPGIAELGWSQVDADVRTGYREYAIDESDPQKTSYRPQIIYSIDYRRTGVRHIIAIFLPLMLIFFISLFAFSFDLAGPNAGQAFGFASGGITAMVAYYYVIQNMSPEVSYFMISDYLYFLFLLLNFIVFLITLFKTNITARYKRWLLVTLHALVITSSVYLFIVWLR